MLEDIVDSKTDSAVLSFFLAAPQRSFSVLEISKRMRIPRLKAFHSLNKLALDGPLRSFGKHGKKYFILNHTYKLLPEIKNVLGRKNLKYQDELFTAIKKLGQIRAAFLSGIFTGYANLPVDLLLVGKVNLKKLDLFLKSAHKLMEQDINYSIMTVNEFLLRYDTFDKFIRDIFDYRHLTVVNELESKKKRKK